MSQAPAAIRSVGVLGGGTAGYFAALAFKRRWPDVKVTVIESSRIPIIGVGEATTTLILPFLHGFLGIDAEELYREVGPTWKLGLRMDWGMPSRPDFAYAFGDADLVNSFVHDGDITTQSLSSQMMLAQRSPVLQGADGQLTSLLPRIKYGYHLNNRPFVQFLTRHAARMGVEHIDTVVEDARLAPDGETILALRTDDGRELAYDFVIDASGFRSQLMRQTLGVPFESFRSTLWADTALVGPVAQSGPMQPYTLVETMDHGWCWRIPVRDEDHRGYVFSSAFCDVETAEREMRAKNPGLGRLNTVRFETGRISTFWKGNTAALGNSYGFVEPLESTSLHMVIVQLAYLLGALETHGNVPETRAAANRQIGDHWDHLRWFLGVHYKFNHRKETPFWRAARADVDISGLAEDIERYTREGPWNLLDQGEHSSRDPTFGHHGLLVLLLGQRVPTSRPLEPRVSVQRWRSHVAAQRTLLSQAVPMREALAIVQANPHMLQESTQSRASWVQQGAEAAVVNPHAVGGIYPRQWDPSTVAADAWAPLFSCCHERT